MISESFAYPKLMGFFEAISAIPRGSYHEEKIADYLERFATERGLDCYRDTLGNVLINCPATAGYEDRAPILLQGHTDMVCEKNEGVEHDFLTDPLELYVEDGWLRARGTTLGADDGVAVAMMLAILDDETVSHPALQCLFTVSEEVGLDGIKGFDHSRITARKLLNLDSPDETTIVVGCAGGLRSSVRVPVAREPWKGTPLKLRISGLRGGHSGEDIDRGRANSNKLMGRVLLMLSRETELRLISVSGGTKDNAIPREAEATVLVADTAVAIRRIQALAAEIKAELCAEDGEFELDARTVAADDALSMTKADTEKLILLLSTVANGVLWRNMALEGMVEYSRNLGIVSTEEHSVELVFSSRSARDTQIDLSAAELDAYAGQVGGQTRHYNRYPGWTYAVQSDIRDSYVAAYREILGSEPNVEVIHAGLECGIIKEAIPDMDIISCGPNVKNLHSPDEALHLGSFERFFRVLLSMLKE